MMTNLSIGEDPVEDFDCSGWPIEKRAELSKKISKLAGVMNVGGAGISTVRVYFDQKMINAASLVAAVILLADEVLPGHNFAS